MARDRHRCALVVYVAVATARPAVARAVAGGADLGSFVWSVWEAFLCVGLCTGLVVAFRELLGRPSARLARLADDAFGVYVVHVPIVVVLQGLLLRTPVPTAIKFLTAAAAGIVLSFRLVERLRRSALARRVL